MRSARFDEYQHAVLRYDNLFLFGRNGRVLVLAQGFFDLLLDLQQGGIQRGGLCGNLGEVRNMGSAAVCRECTKHRIRLVLNRNAVWHPEHIIHLVHLAPLVFVHTVNIGVHCERYRVVTEDGRQRFVIHAAFQCAGGEGMPLRYNNDKQKKPLFSRGLSVCRLLFNSFSKLKIDENYKEKRRLFY